MEIDVKWSKPPDAKWLNSCTGTTQSNLDDKSALVNHVKLYVENDDSFDKLV